MSDQIWKQVLSLAPLPIGSFAAWAAPDSIDRVIVMEKLVAIPAIHVV